MHPDDARILNWGAGKQGGGGGGQANKVAHVWLKNTSFMSNDLTQQVHKFKSGSQVMKEEHERIVQINNTLGTDAETLTENAEVKLSEPSVLRRLAPHRRAPTRPNLRPSPYYCRNALPNRNRSTCPLTNWSKRPPSARGSPRSG